MAFLSVIRRWHFREGMPIREIERRTGLSRNAIRKYLRSGAVEPKFKVTSEDRSDPSAGFELHRITTQTKSIAWRERVLVPSTFPSAI